MNIDESPDYYEGVFKYLMAEFICHKRAQGLKYSAVPYSLRSFSRFIVNSGVTELTINSELITKWCSLRKNEKKQTHNRRVVETKQFLIFLEKKGLHPCMPRVCKDTRNIQSFTPYIFSTNELARFFQECDQLMLRSPSNMPTILPVLFRMLYGCGLRISEALNLKNEDVNLKDGIITVKNSKYNKDRLIPMSTSLINICLDYSNHVHLFNSPHDYFFLKNDKKKIRSDNVYRHFRKILWSANISHGGRGNGPRVHDFRHTFAVCSIKEMADKGLDLYYSLPILSTYLGHSSVDATGQYVRLTQNMFPELVQTVSSLTACVIPGGEVQ